MSEYRAATGSRSRRGRPRCLSWRRSPGSAKAQGRYKKQTGGRGQFGDARIELSPLPRGSGFEFENGIVGGAIPRQFIPAVEKGIVEAMGEGTIAGYPVVDVKVRLHDGAFHTVDSSEMAFKVAGSMAFKNAIEKANPSCWSLT